MSAPDFEACLFDLDGVLTDTAELHYRAWKRLADGLGIPFDRTMNERLKGVGRLESLELIFASAGWTATEEERERLAAEKNAHYGSLIDTLSPEDLLPGAYTALERTRAAGLGLALASASRNAPAVLARLGIADFFDHIVDPASVPHGKPAPDIFLDAARALGTAPERCLGIEDAAAGIAAIKAAGMTALGIGREDALTGADLVLPDLRGFDPVEIARKIGKGFPGEEA